MSNVAGRSLSLAVAALLMLLQIAAAQTAPSDSGSAAALTLPTVEVIGTSPLPGVRIDRDKVPANVQSVTSSALEREGSLVGGQGFFDPIELAQHTAQAVVREHVIGAQRDGVLESGFLRFFGSVELYESGPVREAIFAKLLPREQTHVGAEAGIGVLIKIDKAIDIRGKPIM